MPKRSDAASDAGADPDRLIRADGGTYRTADGRFEVRQSDGTWFLVDTTQADEFGQELVRGRFPTRKTAADALADARQPLPTPLRARRADRAPTRATASRSHRTPPPPPPSWIDRLPASEAATVRRLIRAVDREGIPDAEQVVRRDRDGGSAEIAASLITRRLAAIVDRFAERDRAAALEAIRQVAYPC
ncbi:MAG: hypothetical protein ABR509_08045 [Candidatus Limnocylindria bacterium]